MSSLLVICRYKENKLTWFYKINKDIIIYNKGDDNISYIKNQRIINIDNIGCEEYVYLKFIIDYYDRLPDTIYFSQANPFDHSPDFINLVNLDTSKLQQTQPLSLYYNKFIPGNKYIDIAKCLHIEGNRIFVGFYNGRMQRYFLPLDKFLYSYGQKGVYDLIYNLYNKTNKDIRKCIFDDLRIKPRNFNNKEMSPICHGAIFAVSKEIIRQYPIEYYKYLLQRSIDISKNDGKLFAIVMEFAWLELFKYNPPLELYTNENIETDNKEGLRKLETK